MPIYGGKERDSFSCHESNPGHPPFDPHTPKRTADVCVFKTACLTRVGEVAYVAWGTV